MMTKFVVAMVFAMMLVSIVSAQVAPSFTTQPASTTVKDHSPVILTVAVAGTAPITIQWQENSGKDSLWADIPGANQLTLDISSRYVDRLNNQGFNYRAVATNVAGQAISSSASITITLPPEILSQNVTINGLNNGFVSMSATANGSPLPTVTWSVSGDRGVTYTAVPASSTITNVALSTGYPASTQSTLTLRVFNTNTGFFYRATFTNAAGSATTNDITLLVPLYSPPAFFVHPLSQTIVLGTDVTFSVDYSGADLPTIQWQIQQTQFPYWLDIPGATGNSYTRVAVTDADRGALFRAVATNRLGVAFSNAAVLTIPASTPPAIITQPTFTGRTTWGTVVSLLTRASGSPVPTAQWQRTFGSNMVYSNIGTAGATLPTLSFIAQPNDTLSSFRVVYTNSAGSVTSNSFTLTLANPAAPLIEQQPVNLSVQQGETATFFALVSGAPTPNVQWQVSSDLGYTYTNITGATTTTLNIVAAGPPNYKLYYRLLANNTSGFVFSAPAVLTVVRVDAPIFTIQPTTQEVAVGRSVVFESATIARPPATYQWQSSQDGILFNNVAGATFPTLSFPAVAATQQSTYYRVVATNSAGVTTSNAALLTVYSLNAPVVTVQPKSKNVLSGSTVSLVSLATGTPTPSVQWLSRSGAGQNFTAIPGATQITYTFTATGFQQYRAVFTNTDGTALSAIATVQTYGRLYRVSQSAASILSIGSSSLLLFTIIVLISIAF